MTIATSAVVCVLGLVLLVPLVVAATARLARRLPLALRFALRDADRHRTRTVPAIAAVAATVAGVVALGIALGSDEKENRVTYQPQLAMGDATVTSLGFTPAAPDWTAMSTKLAAAGLRTELMTGEPENQNASLMAQAPGSAAPGTAREVSSLGPVQYGGAVATDVLVSDGDVPHLVRQVPGLDLRRAAQVLTTGGAIVFTGSPQRGGRVQLRLQRWDDQGNQLPDATATVPALFVYVGRTSVPVIGVVAPSVLRSLGLTPTPVGIYLPHPHLSGVQQRDVSEAMAALGGRLYVERGYQARGSVRVVQLLLVVLGSVLMLGGTLTATALALADARPDLATLSAVGATPGTRRAIAAAYALAIGAPGAVLGAAVGFVPGLAVVVPLTTNGASGPFFDVPWLLIVGLVLGLPLLVTVLVWVCGRSRLPMVARLS